MAWLMKQQTTLLRAPYFLHLILVSEKTSINYTRLLTKFNTKSNCSSLVNLELSITIASAT